MHFYITESTVKLGISNNRLTVTKIEDDSTQDYPIDNVEGISVFGLPSISTQLIRTCISKTIPLSFYTEEGHYVGYLASTEHVNPERQLRQVYLSTRPEFKLNWSKQVVRAKLSNSLFLLRSRPEIYRFDETELKGLLHSLKYLGQATDVSQVMGYEGSGARTYFSCLAKLLRNEDFVFQGRSTRPPKDAFNSMISYGYSVIQRNILGAINASGLHPYFAFLHTIKPGHTALASDLLEEWRAFLVDRLVVDLINEGEVDITDFDARNGGVYMKKSTMKLLTKKIGDELVRNEPYLINAGDKKRYGFQVVLQKKMLSLIEAMEKKDHRMYTPFSWSKFSEKNGEI